MGLKSKNPANMPIQECWALETSYKPRPLLEKALNEFYGVGKYQLKLIDDKYELRARRSLNKAEIEKLNNISVTKHYNQQVADHVRGSEQNVSATEAPASPSPAAQDLAQDLAQDPVASSAADPAPGKRHKLRRLWRWGAGKNKEDSDNGGIRLNPVTPQNP